MAARTRAGLVTFLTFGVFGLASPGIGSSCAPMPAIDQAVFESWAAFVGTVTQTQHDGRLARFSVDEVWKGDVAALALVSGGPLPSELGNLQTDENIVTSVDRSYVTGSRYLVVAYGFEDGAFIDNACSATRVYQPTLDQFRPAGAHAPTPVATAPDIVSARIALAAVAVAGIGAVALIRAHVRTRSAGPIEG